MPAALHIAAERPQRLLELLARPVVAIVGSRSSTYYARDIATALARDFTDAGVTVIGGLAEGIEAGAHEGALGAGGTTIAVTGRASDRSARGSNALLRDGTQVVLEGRDVLDLIGVNVRGLLRITRRAAERR